MEQDNDSCTDDGVPGASSVPSCLLERMRSLLVDDVTADRWFLVGKTAENREQVPAHAAILSSASDVFKAMLYGDFAGPQVIEITDVEPAAFKSMLRYIYTDEIAVTAENAFPVLEVANKYLVNALRTAAVNCIKRQFQGPQLLDYLPLLGPYEDLQKIWWNSLDTHATAVLKSDAFLELDHDMLRRIISRNTLAVEETVVFERTIQWAKTHLQRETKKITAETVRKCLGETFYEIRFTQMSIREFGLGPAKSEYLSDKEKVEIYQCFATEEKPPKFKTEARANPKERSKKCRQRTAMLAGSSTSPSNYLVDIDEAWADAEVSERRCWGRGPSRPKNATPRRAGPWF